MAVWLSLTRIITVMHHYKALFLLRLYVVEYTWVEESELVGITRWFCLSSNLEKLNVSPKLPRAQFLSGKWE